MELQDFVLPGQAEEVQDSAAQPRRVGDEVFVGDLYELQVLQRKFLGRSLPDLPETVVAKDWWVARDKPKVFPIPSIKDPD